ncbi:MAG: hypothetical protein DCC67_10620 [Planctomycetota bacterium]|nr:MAG: hypothetical protein DCC67_10620 [Planctomycetota bacterium]
MKTTVEIPDALYRRLKATAAVQGKSVKEYLIEALRDKLAGPATKAARKTGWRAVYGAADPKEVAALQRIIDQEFSGIDPEGWD